jgi:trehalose 6-phosphate synthase
VLTDEVPAGAAHESTTQDFIVVTNRLPVEEVDSGDDRVTWRRSPGGLVTLIHPIMRTRGGSWVGWAGEPGPAPPPFPLEGAWLHPVTLSDVEVDDYYEGQSNATIWPLYHDAVEHPVFHRRWQQAYRMVNHRFAAAAAQLAAPGAVVWVHDYHLQLVPAMLRALRPDVRIGFFLHIPLPPVELFCQMPMRSEIIRGLLGADLVGFQQTLAAHNFLRLARHLLRLRTRGQDVHVAERTVTTGAFPSSIDVDEIEGLAADPAVRSRAGQIRAELGNPRTVLLAVDRLDLSKGIEHRLRAFAELLAERRLDPAETVLVQVAVPNQQRVVQHRSLRERVERQVGRINGEHALLGRSVVHYLHRSYPRDELVALYLAADVMAVTPLRDGMNLVAKEYVAARSDGEGALVLSEFAGAATELRQAFQVNPHDVDRLKDALVEAAGAPAPERRRRMRAMRGYLRRHDVRRWAATYLAALDATEEHHPYRRVIPPFQ